MTTSFTGEGLPPYAQSALKHVPSWFKTTPGSLLGALLVSAGLNDEAVGGDPRPGVDADDSALTAVRKEARIATSDQLSVLANNVGIGTLPVGITRAQMMALIPLLSFEPKTTRKLFVQILTVFYGSTGWDVFEVSPNEVVIELPPSYAAAPGSATYLYQDASEHGSTEGNPRPSYLQPDAVSRGTFVVTGFESDNPGFLIVSPDPGWTTNQWKGFAVRDLVRDEWYVLAGNDHHRLNLPFAWQGSTDFPFQVEIGPFGPPEGKGVGSGFPEEADRKAADVIVSSNVTRYTASLVLETYAKAAGVKLRLVTKGQ